MKPRQVFPVLLAASICTVAADSLEERQAAQSLSYNTGNPADWPPDQDAVAAAPKNHKVLLENDQVRVLEVQLAPAEVENVHHHRWPSVLYIMEAGDFIDRDSEGACIR